MDKNPKALIWVESGNALGHIRIASLLSKALISKGVGVTIASGAFTNDHSKSVDMGGAKCAPLPGEVFDKMGQSLTPNGKLPTTDKAWQQERKNALLEIYKETRPDIIITEQFPFSRGGHIDELQAIISQKEQSLEKKPVLFSIARDDMFAATKTALEVKPMRGGLDTLRRQVFSVVKKLIGNQNATKLKNTMLEKGIGGSSFNKVDFLKDHYDGVIVRGSEEVNANNQASFTNEIKHLLKFVGYFGSPDFPERNKELKTPREVLVSSGGGWRQEDYNLHATAIKAREHTTLKDNNWRHLVSQNCPPEQLKSLQDLAKKHGGNSITVEPNRPDFQKLLANAAFSISQRGYNTVVEVMQSRVPAVIGIGNTPDFCEDDRARSLSDKGLFEVIDQTELSTPERLAKKINQSYAHKVPSHNIAMNGAENAANVIINALAKQRATNHDKSNDAKSFEPSKQASATVKSIIDSGKTPLKERQSNERETDSNSPQR